jgi:integrase
MDTDAILNYWADSMRAQNCTDRTIRERLIFIRAMHRHTGVTSLLDVKKHHLIAYLGRPDLTGRTKQNYRSALHTFYTWMQDEEIRVDNPAARLPKPRVAPTEPNPVTTGDIQTVLDSGIYGHTIMKVLLYAYQGLRASEIAAVAGENIDWATRRIRTAEGKGGKVVWRPIHSLVWEQAQQYPRLGFWFPGLVQGEHVRGKSVSNTLCSAFKRAGIDHKAHDMRKWHGTTLLAAGADSLDVQHSLRHSDGQSMKAYVLPNEPRIRAAMEQLPRVVVPIRHRANVPLRLAA